MKRPTQYDLLKSFMDYLRDEQDLTLLGNSVFKDSSRWVKVPPRKGDKVSINIFFEGKVPNDNQEDLMINDFLQTYGED
ncbi:MAG: hypothetical protein HN464_04535 [Candidatus Marinimicrobia bacterium]|jgi:hypothetical protein|nr:hypothetical protein [Candidatus Neomarinimicrobiota bacterium]